MKRNILKFILLFIVFIVGIFVGYENPEIIQNSKKYYSFALVKMGLRESIFDVVKNQKKIGSEKKIEKKNITSVEFKANSFSVILSKVYSFSGKSASLIMSSCILSVTCTIPLTFTLNVKSQSASVTSSLSCQPGAPITPALLTSLSICPI